MVDTKVSVIITTYKRPLEIVKRSLNSVLNQTYKNIEIIIVDDSPKEFYERECIEKYVSTLNKGIQYIKQPKNMGANFARNTGIKASKGDFIAFLDDDDSWAPQKIELQLNEFKNKDVGMVYCKAQFIEETGKNRSFSSKLKKGYIFDDLLYENFIGGTSFVMFSRVALNYTNGFTETLLANQDWDVYLQVARKFKINYVDEVLVNYYWHDGERITSNPQKKIQGWEYLYHLYRDELLKRPKYLSLWELKISYFYLKTLDINNFISYTIKVLKRNPVLFLKFWTKNLVKILKLYI